MSNETSTVEQTTQTSSTNATTQTTPVSGQTDKAAAVPSPVSTTPPASLLDDAGKPEPEAANDNLLDEAKAEGEAEKPKTEAKSPTAPTVPEKYDIKLPEGVTLDPAELESFTPLAKELGLSNEQAQKVVDFEAARMQKFEAAQQAQFEKIQNDFKAETLKEYGPKWKEEQVYVAKGRDAFADADVRAILAKAGIQNEKSVIRMFAKIGREISEAKMVEGAKGVPLDARSAADLLYPNQGKN
jgi:hypothetical protein